MKKFSYNHLTNGIRLQKLLERIEPGSARLFVDNVNDHCVVQSAVDYINSAVREGRFMLALMNGFQFSKTPEGANFWAGISRELSLREAMEDKE